MKLKGDHLKTDETKSGGDPWDELGPVVWVAGLVGQGSSGTMWWINVCTLTVAIIEAMISFSWIVFGHHSDTTMNRVTEGGQILILYLSASWSGLNAALYRKDEDIMAILKIFPLKGKYKPSRSYRKFAYKFILLVPFITFNWIFSQGAQQYRQRRAYVAVGCQFLKVISHFVSCQPSYRQLDKTEIVYKSNWTFTVFYLPLVQLVLAQLQMTTIIDILTRKMNQLTQELPKCIGINNSSDKQYKDNTRHVYTVMEQSVLENSMKLCCVAPRNLFNINTSRFDREMLVKLISGHALLLQAATLVNTTFGLHTIVSLGRTFIVVTFNFFLFIKNELIYHIQNGGLLDLLTHSFSIIALIVIHLTELWCLVSSSDNFSKSAEIFSRSLFTAAIEDDTEILAEMDIVKCHIASRKDNAITAFGFISVDYSLISCMLGAITTYMVIIIQMGIGEE